ncbi:hypothetical protein [uncultured Jatrophihabitans sp.]|uniref:hypothetical protein n=1 Tax=uncultured Jatrophihabitans sp. TaxID=1610747 RepID=UPI0035CC97A3
MTVQTFPLTGPVNLAARLGHGSLLVRAVDGLDEARVELEGPPDAVERITVELSGPTLRVNAPRQGGLADVFAALRPGPGAAGPVQVTVTVPSGTALDLSTFTASVTVEGRCGGAAVASAVGTVLLDEVDGDLGVRCGTSQVEATHVTGAARVRSANGSGRFGRVDGDLEVGVGRGTVTAGRVGGRVHWRSGAGEASLDAVFGDVDIATGSGAVRIGLPAGVTARVDATSGSGEVVSDLPVSDEPANREHVITVRARTGTGGVRLFRAA